MQSAHRSLVKVNSTLVEAEAPILADGSLKLEKNNYKTNN